MLLQLKTPYFLFLFAPIVLAFAYLFWQDRKRGLTHTLRRRSLGFAALSFCVLGLARPQMGHHATQSSTGRSQLMIAFDVSKSMLAQDINPSRLQFGISFVQRLLDQLPDGVKVGLFPFTQDGYLLIPFTTDLLSINDVAATLNPNITTNQGTDLSASLETLLSLLGRMEIKAQTQGIEWLPTQVLVLSDGETHSPLKSEVMANYTKRRIPIFTVGIGTPEGATVPLERRSVLDKEMLYDAQGRVVTTKLQAENLKKLASETRGDYFTAHFSEVGRLSKRLAQAMEFGRLSTSFKVEREFFPLLFLCAFLLFLIELSTGQWQFAIRALIFAALLSSPAVQADEPATVDPETQAVTSFNKGLELLREGNPLKASEQFQESALLTKDQMLKKKSLYNLGNSFLRQGDPAQALEAYQQAYETKSGKATLDQDADKRASENMALAAKVLEQMKQQSQSGDGQEQTDGEDGKGKQPQDTKGPQQYKDQNLDGAQKQRIFDLVSAEEQQSLQRIQEAKNKGGKDAMNPKPW